MSNFDAAKVTKDCVQWIRDWFDRCGNGCNAVIGISGGKDSSVVAALCVEALGKDRVIGVLMPNGIQPDISSAFALCQHLDIEHFVVPIEDAVDSITHEVTSKVNKFSAQSKTNLPARLRMVTLYAVSQSVNGRVVNTCNLSEDYVGYSTIYGDAAGDFSPLGGLTVTEVKAVGRELGLPAEFVDKVPLDGLCGKTDEDNLGFTYDVLDKYIREGVIDDIEAQKKIEELHYKNEFKMKRMDTFNYMEG